MGSGVTEQQIREHAKRFRLCLEELESELGHPFLTFPAGSCGDSSKLLGQWLTEHGARRLMYIVGERSGKSHVWLETNEIVIDITADQYDDGPGPVYVGKDRSFHEQFQDEVRVTHYLDKELEPGYELCRQWMRKHPKPSEEDWTAIR